MDYQDKSLKYIDATAYDNRAESSILEKYILGLWRPFLKRKISKLSVGRVVIDWGCGTGEYALSAKESKKIYCLDISSIMLSRAREKLKSYHQVEFIHNSGFNNEISSGIGELILTIGVWEYVDPVKLSEEVKRLTKRGSLVLVVFPNIYNDLNWMRSVAKRRAFALKPDFIRNIFKPDFVLIERASFGNVCWFPPKWQFLVLPLWKFSDFIWGPFQKFLPIGVNVYYLFERT